MPHIIVEYSNALDAQIPALLETLHKTLADEGIDIARIKTRGIKIDHAVVGDQGVERTMLHATLLLLVGRDIATKKQYGDALKAKMDEAAPAGTKVTLEIRDMAADTYYL